ncbi:long-chain fatty acid transport protein [Psychromonas sp. CNPT3]|uniref:outer membrane protein transport protein n=1 Tax=Psychromonas sp. CNPT3 TaxID=314282 RepID=UPI00006E9146|nr:outer membrane protein transport protein [Psychromonas sp. CNPT3]AGH81836.1 long-chain fatty acid transport protein [Psychromonas sp. CNPT3]
MIHKKRLNKVLLALSIAFTASQVNAAGFQLNAQSATGLGRAFAGDAVIADNASVASRNAAAMALFDSTALSTGFNVLITDIKVSNGTYKSPFIAGGEAPSDYDNAGGTSVAPNFHLIVPLNDKFAVGMSLYSNFATRTEFDNSFVGAEYGGLTDVKSMNLGLLASYRINKQWSIGGGLDIIYGKGKLQRHLSSKLPANSPVGPLKGKEVLNADTAGFGLGFNLGTVFELDKNNRFGLSYHYSPKLHTKGDIFYNDVMAKDDTLYMAIPDMAEFSGYHRLTDSKFAVHYSVQWIGWSSFKSLDSKAHGTIKEYQWKDTYHLSLGTTYYLNNDWTLRAGYMYDASAQDEVTSISVPDSNRQWFSAGFTYQLNENSNVDFGATYLLGKDVQVTESTPPLSSIAATTHANAILMAMQYSYKF